MPNLKFLRAVAEEKVTRSTWATKRGGIKYRFRGGEATARKHASAGYIIMPGVPYFGHHSCATLTDKGRAALSDTGGDNG